MWLNGSGSARTVAGRAQTIPSSAGVSTDARIVLYCDGVDCPMSHDLGEKMLPLGYTNLLQYKNGWDEWSAAKAPADSGLVTH